MTECVFIFFTFSFSWKKQNKNKNKCLTCCSTTYRFIVFSKRPVRFHSQLSHQPAMSSLIMSICCGHKNHLNKCPARASFSSMCEAGAPKFTVLAAGPLLHVALPLSCLCTAVLSIKGMSPAQYMHGSSTRAWSCLHIWADSRCLSSNNEWNIFCVSTRIGPDAEDGVSVCLCCVWARFRLRKKQPDMCGSLKLVLRDDERIWV